MPFSYRTRRAVSSGAFVLLLLLTVGPGLALDNIFFQHHSVGRNLIADGNIRQAIDDHNLANGTSLELWDHDYNYIGLMDPDGVMRNDYNIPGDTRIPSGQLELWATENEARTTILANHELIVLKLGYNTCIIESDAQLEAHKQDYLGIRDAIDGFAGTHPDKVFIVTSPSPLHWRSTTREEADRARAFADWLKSREYLGGRDNLFCFDFFDHFASPPEDPVNGNMLRLDYANTEVWSDSHPTAFANMQVAPVFTDFLIDTARAPETASAPVPDAKPAGLAAYPNPFNPRTTIAFETRDRGPVKLAVYDVSGRQVRVLRDREILDAGRHVSTWDGTGRGGVPVPSGVYFTRLETVSDVRIRKLTLTR